MGFLERLRLSSWRRSWRWFRQLVRSIRSRRAETRLTVAVDVDPLTERLSGIGWYLYRLLLELREVDGVILRLYGRSFLDPTCHPVVDLPRSPSLEPMQLAVPDDLCLPPELLRSVLRLVEPWLVAFDGNEVVFAPNFFPPRRLRAARGSLVVALHDLAMKRFPETLREETLRLLERHLGAAARRAAAVVTGAEAIRQELLKASLGLSAHSIHTIPHGPGHLDAEGEERPPAGLEEEPFLLFVGAWEPRKHLTFLIEAVRPLALAGVVGPLVLCGGGGWKNDRTREEIDRGEQEGWIKAKGYLPDECLRYLYRRARLVVCPSLYEGFGFPVLEAMVFGAPIVCSDLPVFREVAGEAALFVELEEEAWRTALRRVWCDEALRATLSRRGLQKARTFSWHRAAMETLDLFRHAGGSKSAGET